MTDPLVELADAAEDTARDQQLLAGKARTMAQQRQRGWSWSKVFERESQPGLIELLARSTRGLVSASRAFRRALARSFADEGASTRQIAQRLGVTHQRISTVLNERGP